MKKQIFSGGRRCAGMLVLGMCPFFFGATDGRAEESTVLIDGAHLNGGFEQGLKPWVSRKTRDMREHFSEAGVATAAQGAPAGGGRMLVLRAVNEDLKRTAAMATVHVDKLSLAQGKKFRLTWQARARAKGEFDRAQGRIAFNMPDGSVVIGGSYVRETGTEWTRHMLEVIYTGEAAPESVDVSVGFMRLGGLEPKQCEGYVDAVRFEQMPVPADQLQSATAAESPVAATGEPARKPVPVTFELKSAGQVTLVIEDESGRRVRNLISGEFFEAGKHTVGWDGLDEGEPAAVKGSQSQAIKREAVGPGTYRVRGLSHDPLKLSYDFTVSPNVGTPPWPTELTDGNGGWLADHGTPSGIGYIPAKWAPGGREQMLITCPVAEAAQALSWVTLDGHKVAGRNRLGGTWTGASHVSADTGGKRNPDVYLYTFVQWQNKEGREIRLMGMTKDGALTVGKITHPFMDGVAGKQGDVLSGTEGGMAVHDGVLVYSLFGPERLFFVDVRGLSVTQAGKPLGEAAVEKPRALAFERDGALLVLSGNRVLRYRVGAFPAPLSAPQVVIASGLEEPRTLTVDEAGNLYIADWGESHQVKIFTKEGRPLRTLGKPGRPRSGTFDPEHMNYPFGVAMTPEGGVWVTMRPWRVPKTVAVWRKDGTLERNFYGPTSYGGGGFLDPGNQNRFLYGEKQGGVEFSLDWLNGRASPARIYWLADETPVFQPTRWLGPMFPRRIYGRNYITNEFGGPTGGAKLLTLWRDDAPGGMRPAAFVGAAVDWPGEGARILAEHFPGSQDWTPAKRFRAEQTLLVAWSDANGDGVRQESECGYRPMADEPGMGLVQSSALAGDNFTVLITHDRGVLKLTPQRVENGVPYYDLDKDLRPVATELSYGKMRSSGRLQALESADGGLVVTGGPIMGVRDGKVKWIYHSQWPSLHNGHAAPRLPEYPGQLLATTRLLGPLVTPRAGEAGPLWAINSDKGLAYLLTTDGLFVGTLFDYVGDGQPWKTLTEAVRGMDLTKVNYDGESFFPSINQLPDGRIYMVAGKTHSSLVRVDGLDTVRRFEAPPITIGAEQEQAIRTYREERTRRERAGKGSTTARIARLERSPVIDGELGDWPAPNWLPVGKGRITSGFSAKDVVWSEMALAVDKKRLYVAVRTRQKNLLFNSGADAQSQFRTGGAVDVQLSTLAAGPDNDGGKAASSVGDVRVLVSLVNGRCFATRFRPRVPGVTDPVVYESTVSREEIDRVEDVSKDVEVMQARIKLDKLSGGLMGEGEFEQIELAIPLSTLGWDPAKLPATRGDVGVLLGKRGTTEERVYWHNTEAGLINDEPSEAKLNPGTWGEFRVQ